MMCRQNVKLLVSCFFVSALLLTSSLSFAAEPSPPVQPETGPGGDTYLHGKAAVKGPYWAEGHDGDDNYRYVIYEPSDPVLQEGTRRFVPAWLGRGQFRGL